MSDDTDSPITVDISLNSTVNVPLPLLVAVDVTHERHAKKSRKINNITLLTRGT